MKKILRYTLIALIVLSIPGVVIGYNIYTLVEWLGIRDLEANGVKTEAVVVAREASEGTRMSSYDMTLSYAIAGRPDSLTTEQGVDQALYATAPIGSKLTLLYDFQAPENVYLSGNDAYIMHIVYSAGGDLLLIFLAVGVYRIYRKSLRSPASAPSK